MWWMTMTLCGWAAPDDEGDRKVGAFVDLEWRGMVLADHLSHGPGFAFGATLLGDHLRVGLSGYARPGPINPATFPVAVNYKGEGAVAFRSDGGVAGLVVAPGMPLAGGALRMDLPVMAGYGGFGFYLHGEDRKTPDGRKPSAWENELLDARDSRFGLGLDAGVRLAWAAAEHVEPYLAVRWSAILAYDTYVRSSYGGPSVGLGLSVGAF